MEFRKRYLFFLEIFFLISFAGAVTGDLIQDITGGATSNSISLGINVSGLPALNIIKPENKTYITNVSLPFEYISGGESVWFNIDNGANQTTSVFNTTEGGHILYAFANNSFGEIKKNVTFTINSSLFRILYNDYANIGNTTDFNRTPYEDMFNLSGIILENAEHGKIAFNEKINLTDDENSEDGFLDLDNNVNIASSNIFLNSTALPNFNKSATLYFYNLTFSNPRVLRNGAVCSSDICTNQSYSNGILSVNVLYFTNYSVEETPSEEAAEAPPSEAGGGIAPKKFSIDKKAIEITLKQGEVRREIFAVKNVYKKALTMKVSTDLEKFIRFSEEEFELKPGEEKEIFVDFIASEDTLPDMYFGKIVIEGDNVRREILVSLEVESKEAVFDVEVIIPDESLKVIPGQEVFADVIIHNVKIDGEAEVFVEYIIMNSSGKIITEENETLLIDEQVNFIKGLLIPDEAEPGYYVFYVRATYDKKVGSGSALFEVLEVEIPTKETYLLLVVFLIIIFLIIVILRKRKRKK